ncbi:RNA polymerase sigma factor, partial [uncultured Alistipes sp.]
RGLPPVEEPSAEETARIPEEVLMRFVNELPDGYRTVFNLYCIEEYSHREIAEMLGINEKSSSSQLFRARMMLSRKIRAWLDKQGL